MASLSYHLYDDEGADGCRRVFLLLTVDRKKLRIRTDFRVPARHFIPGPDVLAAAWVRKGHPLHADLNKAMQAAALIAQAIVLRSPSKELTVLRQHILDAWAGKSWERTDMPDLHQWVDHDLKERRANHRQRRADRLRAYWADFTQSQNIRTWVDLTPAAIHAYRKALEAQGNTANTIAGKMRVIRAILAPAEKLPGAPKMDDLFKGIRFTQTPRRPEVLTIEEIRRIHTLPLPPGPMDRARDAFMLQYLLGGARIGDVLHLRHSQIRDGAIYNVQAKTGIGVTYSIEPELQAILAKYPYNGQSPFILPFLPPDYDTLTETAQNRRIESSTARINRQLNGGSGVGALHITIASLTGITKHLTTHIARHAFTSNFFRHLSLAELSALVGHTNPVQTQTYIARLTGHETRDAHQKALSIFRTPDVPTNSDNWEQTPPK